MSRLSRKNRTDIEFKGCGGLTDAFDDAVKGTWRINDDEYDYICQTATDNELDSLMFDCVTFSDKRHSLTVINKFVNDYKELK
tara:strand:- start:124 stop:372 length:249 start_codon:yes stop_codon:yes gene_type:complete